MIVLKVFALPAFFFVTAVRVALPLLIDAYRASAEARARREEGEL